MARYIVAITGGIGSGKSLACDRLHWHGIEVINADLIARELVVPGQPVLAEIVARFGSDIIDGQGQLRRRRLRELIFADQKARHDLEAIMHPRVRVILYECAHQAQSTYAALEIPLLIDRNHYPWLDRIIAVDVDKETQIQRLMVRDGVDESLAQSMLAAQASRKARLLIATDVIINDRELATFHRRVDALHSVLARAAINSPG